VTPERQRVQDTKQLQRLRSLREQRALRERAAAQRQRDAALETVRQSEARLAAQRAERDALVAYVLGVGAPDLPRLASFAVAHRELLEEAVERTAYYLDDERRVLNNAEHKLSERHAAWIRSVGSLDAAGNLLQDAKRGASIAAEQRAEREDAPRIASSRGPN
jgi:hypothetical protein